MQISGGIVMSGNWSASSSPPVAPATVTYKWFMGEPYQLAGTSNTIGITSVHWGRRNMGSNIFTANNQIVFAEYWSTESTSRLNYYLTDASQSNPTQSQQNVIISAMTTGTTLDFYRYSPNVLFAETLTLTDNARRVVIAGTGYIVANVNANFKDGVNDGPGQVPWDDTNGNYYMFGFANVYFTSNILTAFPPATVTYKWFIGENPNPSGISNAITMPSVRWGRVNLGPYENPVWTGNNQIVFQRPMRSPASAGNVAANVTAYVSRANGYLSGNVEFGLYKTLSNAEVNVFVSAMTTGTTIDFYAPGQAGFAETVTLTQNAMLWSVLNNDYIIANVNVNLLDGVNDGPGEYTISDNVGARYMFGFANINYTSNILLSFPA